MSVVLVPASRLERWVVNFGDRHGGSGLAVAAGALTGEATDGSRFAARGPFDQVCAGPAEACAFAAARQPPEDWGVLLVRKGGFAVARVAADAIKQSKVCQRHV